MKRTLLKVLLPVVIPVTLALSAGVASASVSPGHAVRSEPAVHSTQLHTPAGAYLGTGSGVGKAGKVSAGVKPDTGEVYYGEWCYRQGSGPWACLNAWGGGPDVNVSANKPNGTPNNYFELYAESDGYYELIAPNGECIGDRGNSQQDAQAGLVPCGTGWGSNFKLGTYQTGACPNSDSFSFLDNRWGGLLGPPAGWGNGSPFYLNKPATPGTFCFGLYT
jgi:hypothetical protein